jgi:hypothetical protein
MSVFYVANQNGDWWKIDTESGEGMTLFVISEADLARAVAEENPELPEIDLADTDKLERAITRHGEAIDLEL